MAKKKITTIDGLAGMVKGEFDRVYTRIGEVDDRLEQFGKKFTERFDNLESRLDHLESVFIASHDRRLDRLEDNVRIIKTVLKIR